MRDASIDRVRIYVVGAGEIEVTVNVRSNYSVRVAQCAADVHVSGCIGGDESRIIASPCPDDLRGDVSVL